MCTPVWEGDVIVQREGAQSLERWPPPVDINVTLDQTHSVLAKTVAVPANTKPTAASSCVMERYQDANRTVALRA